MINTPQQGPRARALVLPPLTVPGNMPFTASPTGVPSVGGHERIATSVPSHRARSARRRRRRRRSGTVARRHPGHGGDQSAHPRCGHDTGAGSAPDIRCRPRAADGPLVDHRPAGAPSATAPERRPLPAGPRRLLRQGLFRRPPGALARARAAPCARIVRRRLGRGRDAPGDGEFGGLQRRRPRAARGVRPAVRPLRRRPRRVRT